VDIDPVALDMAQHNAQLNGVSIEVALQASDDWDVLLASDVLYETGNEHFVRSAAATGRQVLLSDPLRHGTPRPGMTVVHEYQVRTLPDVDYPIQRALIHVLRADSAAS
jgi:predicted nicotinamide N-methyase